MLETIVAADTSAIRVTRLDADGDVSWTRTYAEGYVRGTALATLTGEDLAFAWTEDVRSVGLGGYRAKIARLDAAGAVQSRHPFGPQDGTSTSVSALCPTRRTRSSLQARPAPSGSAGLGATTSTYSCGATT